MVIKFRSERNWKRYHHPKSQVISLMIEVGELAEHFQYLDGAELKKYIKKFKSEIADELADVLWWVLIIASDLNIDLEKAFYKKMKKNAKKYPVPKNGEEVGKLFNKLKKSE